VEIYPTKIKGSEGGGWWRTEEGAVLDDGYSRDIDEHGLTCVSVAEQDQTKESQVRRVQVS
jgi:hypothetical protein